MSAAKVYVCSRCRDKKSVRKLYEDAPPPLPCSMAFRERTQGLCDLKCGRRSPDLWPMCRRSVLERVAEAAKEPEVEQPPVRPPEPSGA